MCEVLVDNFDPLLRPAQLQCPLAQTVLALSGLAVDGDLCCRRLPNINVSLLLEVGRLNFWIIAHRLGLELKAVSGWRGGGPALASGTPNEGSGGSAARGSDGSKCAESGAVPHTTVPFDLDARCFSWVDAFVSIRVEPIRCSRASTRWRVRNKSGRKATKEISQLPGGVPGDPRSVQAAGMYARVPSGKTSTR